MLPVQKTLLLCAVALLAFIYSFLSPSLNLTPQLIAIFSIIQIAYIYKYKNLNIPILIFIVTTLIFTTGGLSSDFFIFTHFLLFLIAFFYHPIVTITFSSFLIVLLANTISPQNLINLLAILLVTPQAWVIAKLHKKYQDNLHELAQEHTDMEFWLHLEFKKRILKNLELLSRLVQSKEVETITENEKYFLNSTRRLVKELDEGESKYNK